MPTARSQHLSVVEPPPRGAWGSAAHAPYVPSSTHTHVTRTPRPHRTADTRYLQLCHHVEQKQSVLCKSSPSQDGRWQGSVWSRSAIVSPAPIVICLRNEWIGRSTGGADSAEVCTSMCYGDGPLAGRGLWGPQRAGGGGRARGVRALRCGVLCSQH